jgi:hypothetical protein
VALEDLELVYLGHRLDFPEVLALVLGLAHRLVLLAALLVHHLVLVVPVGLLDLLVLELAHHLVFLVVLLAHHLELVLVHPALLALELAHLVLV